MDIMDRAREAAKMAAEKVHNAQHRVAPSEFVELIKRKLGFSKFILVSNREPYTHRYDGDEIRFSRSPSGLTIALDSIAQAVEGTWIASASGNADRESADHEGKIRVPPDAPTYTLKRLWIPKELNDDYYLGFSNEVLWPLSHVVYVRPRFDERYWKAYQKVNQMFAEAVLEEIQEDHSLVFLQDYHLALCAKYIKEKRPDVPIVFFWHIPWPNPEIFRICPWKQELLEGLLANDLVGFHLFNHGQNFLEAVDLVLESRIDWEKRAVYRQGVETLVKAYPIGVDFARISQAAAKPEVQKAMANLRRQHRINSPMIGLGVDRVDYTKGILERMDALKKFFEQYPDYWEKLTYIQIGIPNRMGLEEYQNTMDLLEKRIDYINHRFGSLTWAPILFFKEVFNFDELIPFYRMANFCLVSSLHDGMNLVAKEFVASRVNQDGVLILSHFTGAARELEQAVQINPYHVGEISDAILTALQMSPEEQRNRMQKMQVHVQENDIYSWASQIINDMARFIPHAA